MPDYHIDPNLTPTQQNALLQLLGGILGNATLASAVQPPAVETYISYNGIVVGGKDGAYTVSPAYH